MKNDKRSEFAVEWVNENNLNQIFAEAQSIELHEWGEKDMDHYRETVFLVLKQLTQTLYMTWQCNFWMYIQSIENRDSNRWLYINNHNSKDENQTMSTDRIMDKQNVEYYSALEKVWHMLQHEEILKLLC